MTFDAFETFVSEHLPSASARGHRLAVPVWARRSADLLTPVSAYLSLREQGTFGFLLESVEGGERLARYSFLGKRPYLVIESRGGRSLIHRPAGVYSGDGAPHGVDSIDQAAFGALGTMLDGVDQAPVPDLPRFTGGAVGFVGYDSVRQVETLGVGPPDLLGLPDGVWAFYDLVAAFDHVRHQLVLMATVFLDTEMDLRGAWEEAQDRLLALETELAAPAAPGEPIRLLDEASSSVERDAFESAVRTAKEHITEGDIFQVVLSQRFATPFEGDPFNLYRALRQVNPSPYLFYVEVDGLGEVGSEFTLVGSSPEVLARVDPRGDDRRAEVLPIAGTRPRGATPEADQAFADELLADTKERAEHLMLVDLGRNDLGRVSDLGSVRLERYAQVERYSHVMHLVSSVTGAVGDRRATDILAACFPAGTVSGAPKVRAMEIIDELEPIRRGPYAGAVGYAGFDGALDTCIAIRTFVVKDDTAYVQAGAGVVADSDPAAEYDETRHKAAALIQALQTAAGDLL